MTYSTTFDSTPELRQKALASHASRRPRATVWGITCLAVGIFFIWLDGAGFIEGVAIAAGAIGILADMNARRIGRRRALARGVIRTHVIADDEGLTIEMPLISARIAWEYVDDLRRSPELWTLMYGQGVGLPIPTDAMSPEMRDFIERSFAESKRRRAAKAA